MFKISYSQANQGFILHTETELLKVWNPDEFENYLYGLTISSIVTIIKYDWTNVSVHAKPYLEAMETMDQISDNYYQDSGAEIVTKFRINASSWRGELARAVKKELKRRIK